VSVDTPPDERPPFFRWKLSTSHQHQWLALCYWAERYLQLRNEHDVDFNITVKQLVPFIARSQWFIQMCNSVQRLSLVSDGSCYHDPENPHDIDMDNRRNMTIYVQTLFDFVNGFFYSKFGNVDKLFAPKGQQVPNPFSSVYKCN
jgi:hypothetical protein